MIWKILKNSLLSPLFIIGTFVNFYAIFLIVKEESFVSAAPWFMAGCLAGLFTFKFLYRFEPIYVFGHELAHWLAAKICGRRTGKLSLGLKSGSVEVEKPNTFILLAPYFFPTLTVAILPLYFLLPLLKHQQQATVIFTFLCGSTFAHHLYMNARLIMKTKQSDFDKPGHFYSACLLSYINTLIIFTVFIFFTPSLKNIKFYGTAINKISVKTSSLYQSFFRKS